MGLRLRLQLPSNKPLASAADPEKEDIRSISRAGRGLRLLAAESSSV